MARLITCGFEFRDRYAEGAASGSGTLETTTVRTGSAAWSFGSSEYWVWSLSGGASTKYARSYVRFSSWTAGSPPATVLSFGGDAAAGAGVSSTGVLSPIQFNGTAIAAVGTGTSNLSLNTWYLLETAVTVNGSNQVTSIVVKLDEVQIGSWSGTMAADPSISNFYLGDQYGANTQVVICDDVAVNDAVGSDQNSYPGPGKVHYLWPASDPGTSSVNMTKPGGATTNLHTAVDNRPPVYETYDGTSASAEDYIRDIIAPGSSDALIVVGETYTSKGIIGPIKTLQPVAIVGSDNATDTAGDIGCISNPAITTLGFSAFDNGVASSTPSTWNRVVGTLVYVPSVTLGTGPSLRVRKITATTRAAIITSLAMVVDEAPVTALSGTIAGSGTVSGNMRLSLPLSGTVGGSGTVAGTLKLGVGLSGTITGLGSLSGTMTLSPMLSGVIAGSSTFSGDLTVVTPFMDLYGRIEGGSQFIGFLTVTNSNQGYSPQKRYHLTITGYRTKRRVD